jgi:hypothetical protein
VGIVIGEVKAPGADTLASWATLDLGEGGLDFRV